MFLSRILILSSRSLRVRVSIIVGEARGVSKVKEVEFGGNKRSEPNI